MSLISKLLDVLKMESTREMENKGEMSASQAYADVDSANKSADIANETTDRQIEIFEERVVEKEKESNSQITNEDVECYALRLSDLNKPLISDGHGIEKQKELGTEDKPGEETTIEEPEQELKEAPQPPVREISKPPKDKPKPEPFKYIFPSVNLLDKRQDSENHAGEAEQRKDKLKQTLEVFGIKADIVDISHGARFTRFEIQIGKGVRIRDVLKIEDDIKLNLGAVNIHIEAPVPGRTTIGIDVENRELSIVTLKEMIESKEFMENPSDLAVTIGKDTVGNTIVESLENMCHLLIGGTTGSGRSVCISSIIMNILYKADPNNVKLMMIDTKAVNLTMYNGIPHLLIPVVTDLRKSTAALEWAVAEMTDRYRKFAELGAKDLTGYNKAVEKYAGAVESPQKIPEIIIWGYVVLSTGGKNAFACTGNICF